MTCFKGPGYPTDSPRGRGVLHQVLLGGRAAFPKIQIHHALIGDRDGVDLVLILIDVDFELLFSLLIAASPARG